MIPLADLQFVGIAGPIINPLLKLGHDIGIGGVQEGDQPFDLGGCLFPESGDVAEGPCALPLLDSETGQNRTGGLRIKFSDVSKMVALIEGFPRPTSRGSAAEDEHPCRRLTCQCVPSTDQRC